MKYEPPHWVTYLFLILFSVAIIYGELSKPDKSSLEWGKITNEQYGFSFDYPLKWYVRIYDEMGARGSPESKATVYSGLTLGSTYISIDIRETSNPTIEQAKDWIDEELNKAKTIIDQKITTFSLQEDVIDHKPVLRLIYSVSVKDIHGQMVLLKGQQIYCPRNQDILVMSIKTSESTYQSDLLDFERIVASFTPKE